MSRASMQRTFNSLKEKGLLNWTIDKVNGNSYFLTLPRSEASMAWWLPHTDASTPGSLHHTDASNDPLHHTDASVASHRCIKGQPEGGVLGSEDTSHLYTLDSSKEESNIDNIDKNNTQKKSIKIPERFKPVSKLLIEWWENHRVGVKSETAWSLLIGEFDKILSDESVNGNIEAISQTLYNGITSSEKGKPWQSIRYSNWILYNKKRWLAFKESQSTVEKSPQRSTIIIPDYHKNA
jgi:hypothetical protein